MPGRHMIMAGSRCRPDQRGLHFCKGSHIQMHTLHRMYCGHKPPQAGLASRPCKQVTQATTRTCSPIAGTPPAGGSTVYVARPMLPSSWGTTSNLAGSLLGLNSRMLCLHSARHAAARSATSHPAKQAASLQPRPRYAAGAAKGRLQHAVPPCIQLSWQLGSA